MASATAFKAIGGQIQNLHMLLLYSHESQIEERYCFSFRGLTQITS